MIITCENCKTRFNLDESLLDVNGSTVRCSRCRHMFIAFPRPPEPEFDPLELDNSDFDQNFELDTSDYDDVGGLTEDRSQETVDAEETVDFEELELETIDPDEIEIEIEDADTVSAEEPPPDLSVKTDMSEELELAEETEPDTPDLSEELDLTTDPDPAEETTGVPEELALDFALSEGQGPDFDLAFDLDEKEPETGELDLEIPNDKKSDLSDSKMFSPGEEHTDTLEKETKKHEASEDMEDDFDLDEQEGKQEFDGLDDLDDPDFDDTDLAETETPDTSSHESPKSRVPARASLIPPVDPEDEWMDEKVPPAQKNLR